MNGQNYMDMLEKFLWPRVKYKRLYFQHDGAPAHYALLVRQWLDQKFRGKWIGRRGPYE